VPSSDNFPGTATGEKYTVMGVFDVQPSRVEYEESVYVGYRYYDAFGIDPAYEFGYGLSYTTFEYGDVVLSGETFDDGITASVTITNSGEVAGKEVVQLYLGAPRGGMDKPVRELKGFAKTGLLAPGTSETVDFVLQAGDLASFDESRSAWIADSGLYGIAIGSSSRDIRSTATFGVGDELVVEEVLADL
jgi:beta-glucosidase